MLKTKFSYTLQQLADKTNAQLVGDPQAVAIGVAALDDSASDIISYFADKRYLSQLKKTAAGFIIINAKHKDLCHENANLLLVENPQLAWLKILNLFDDKKSPAVGIHPSAVVSSSAKISPTASIGPFCVIEDDVFIGENTVISAGCTIAYEVSIAADCFLYPRVTLYKRVKIGARTIIHSGVVIGADGFGNAKDKTNCWQKIPQLGSVQIGADVEIGANTTIDCGALADSTIADGVRIDNLVYLAHNIHVGAHTAIAAGTLVAGTVTIGSQCLIGGSCCIGGHLSIADNIILTATSSVSKSITKPGAYSSGNVVQDRRDWQKSVVHYRNLNSIVKRIKKLEDKND